MKFKEGDRVRAIGSRRTFFVKKHVREDGWVEVRTRSGDKKLFSSTILVPAPPIKKRPTPKAIIAELEKERDSWKAAYLDLVAKNSVTPNKAGGIPDAMAALDSKLNKIEDDVRRLTSEIACNLVIAQIVKDPDMDWSQVASSLAKVTNYSFSEADAMLRRFIRLNKIDAIKDGASIRFGQSFSVKKCGDSYKFHRIGG